MSEGLLEEFPEAIWHLSEFGTDGLAVGNESQLIRGA